MNDQPKAILLDLSKFVATGVLAFFSSCLYTNVATRPAANVSIIPLSIEPETACSVSPDRLQTVRDATRLTSDPEPEEYTVYLLAADVKQGQQGWKGALQRNAKPPTQPDEYAVYLRTIATDYIFPHTVKPDLWSRLQTDRVIECASPEGGSGYPTNICDRTVLAIQGTVIIDQPASYILDRECHLVVKGQYSIPVRAYAGDIVTRAPQNREERTITVRKTSSILFKYEPSMVLPQSKVAFRQEVADGLDALRKALSADLEYTIGINCEAISASGREVQITGHPVHFVNGSLEPARPGLLARIWSALV